MKPKIFIPTSKIPVATWIDNNESKCNKVACGNTFYERLGKLVDALENMGFESAEIIFRKNQMENSDFKYLFKRLDELFEKVENLEKKIQ